MLTLILMRHAKSDWSTPSDRDFDRPLNKRGRRSATALGTWLRDRGIRPGEAQVSSARRTRETWERLEIGDCSPRFLDQLYHASAMQMMTALKQAKADTVLMIGHNPGIAGFATDLIGPTEVVHPDFHRYPTCATSIIHFEVDAWQDIEAGCDRLAEFIVPRDLGVG